MNLDISADSLHSHRDELMTTTETSILSVRAALARVLAYAFFGLAAGVVLWLIEASDRIAVLNHSINGVGETVRLVVLFGVAIAGTGIVGLALGIVATALEVVRQFAAMAVSRVRQGLQPMALEAASLIAAALVVTLVLKTISGQFPGGL